MQFELLGPVRVTVAGQAARIGSARQRAVLAVLLLSAGRTVSVNRLIDAVWGDQPAETALNLVRTYVWRLRSLLTEDGETRLETEPAGYRLRVLPGELDAAEFDRLVAEGRAALGRDEASAAATQLRAALELWRGEPLQDVSLHGGDLAAELQRMAEARVAGLEARIEADLALGRHEELVGELRQLAAQHPLREGIAGSLMLACYRSGRQSDALDAYRTLRATLVGDLGLEPGPAVRDLHERILNADPGLQPDAAESRPGPRHTPRQLPAAPGNFTGRAEEVSSLTSLVEGDEQLPGTVVICAIDGMGGIGKTALALYAAHLLADQYPDGQLFIDLHGYTKGLKPREPGEALAIILQALGIPSRQIPPALDARAALYRDRLSGTRTLILLDNAHSEEQIRPLLPGSGQCLALITSRTRLRSLDDAYIVPLDVLPPDHAVALLRAVAGPAHAAVGDAMFAEIAQLCGRLPLALRIAGGLLRHRSAWTAQNLADKLREGRPGLRLLRDGARDLAAVFELSYQALTESQRLLFRRLGLLPGQDADNYAVAALMETDLDEAERSLQDLVDHNLLTEPTVGRYRLHDLIRQHAQILAVHDPSGRHDTALERLVNYYQYTAERADAQVARYPRPMMTRERPTHSPELLDAQRGYAWLRAERANLEACIKRAITDSHDECAVALIAGLTEIMREDGPLPHAFDLHTAAAAAAERLGDTGARARAMTQLGLVRLLADEYSESQQILDEAVRLHQAAGDRRGLAGARVEQSVALRLTGDLDGALRVLDEALEIFAELEDPKGRAGVLTEMGVTHYLTGDVTRAIEDLEEALVLYRRLGFKRGEADAMGFLGGMRHTIGDTTESMNYLQATLKLCRELGNRSGEGRTLIEMSAVYRMTGDLAGAKRAVDEGLMLYREMGNRLGRAIAWESRARIARAAGELGEAIDDFEQALGVFREIGARGNQAWVLNSLAGVVTASGDPARGLTLYQDALELARESKMRDEQANALEGIGGLRLAAGAREEGAEQLAEARAIFEQLGQKGDADRIAALLEEAAGAEGAQ